MDGFSVASLTTHTETISHRLISIIAELRELLRSPRNPAHRQLDSLSSRLQAFRQTTQLLQEALARARVISPGLRQVLDSRLTTCAHAIALFDKQIRSNPTTGPDLTVLGSFDDLVVAYAPCFTSFLRLLSRSVLLLYPLRGRC
jgi:hypothetical protein